MKVREYEIYRGYYCGVCKYIGQTFGQIPRLVLSYDAAFLSLLLASADDSEDHPEAEHCIAHHIEKRTIIRNGAIAYAGDVMLILAWHKLADDARDENSRKARALMILMQKQYKQLAHRHSELCRKIETLLEELHRIEDSKCSSIDQVAEPFAKIMQAIFAHGTDYLYGASLAKEEFAKLHESFANIGYHMGKWIYLMDAADDIGENISDGAYNPLLYRFCYENSESAKEFHERIKDNLEFNLFHYLAVISQQMDGIEIKKNKGILDNIIYFGLNRKTEEILSGEQYNKEETVKENENESI